MMNTQSVIERYLRNFYIDDANLKFFFLRKVM